MSSEIQENFGNQLRKWRKKRNLTQVDLSVKTDIDDANIRTYEKGDGNPTLKIIGRLAKALNVKPEDLLKVDE